MKQKDIMTLAFIAIVAGLISLLISNAMFGAGQKPSKVPIVQPLSADFPDVKNDPNYKVIFYNGALDPTQLIQIGNTQNSTPFNGPKQ
jgi:hypothetical protein